MKVEQKMKPEVLAILEEAKKKIETLQGFEVELVVRQKMHLAGISYDHWSHTVCKELRVPKYQYLSKSRTPKVVLARQMCLYFLYHYSPLSLNEISRLMGYGDHTSVMHHKDKVLELLQIGDELIVDAHYKCFKAMMKLKPSPQII